MPENNIRNISISATGDTQKAEDALNKLIIKLKTIKDLVGAGMNFNTGFKNIATTLRGIKDVKLSKTTASNLTALADAITKFQNAVVPTQTSDSVQKIVDSLASLKTAKVNKKLLNDLPQLGIVLSFFARQFTPADVQKLVQLSVALQYLSGVNLKGMNGIAGLAQQMQAFTQAQNSGVTQTVQQTQNITALGSSASRTAAAFSFLASGVRKLTGLFTGTLLGAVSKIRSNLLRISLTIATLPFKRLALQIRDVTKRFAGFLAAIKRIAVYRAIRSALKEISQGFREGVENLYQYSLLMNGTFSQSMDTIATAALYAKDSLAAMAAPIINVLAPAIDFLVDKFVDALNTVNELIASLTGATTWTRALKYPKAYAEALDGANGRAKELRATLLGFDEINRLDDNKRGSRGSAADQLDYSQLFEEQEVTSKFKGIAERIKQAFLEGDFYDLGTELGEKIRNGLNNIPWESIQGRIEKNAMSASSFINGIVDTEGLPEAIGETLAMAFNTITLKIKVFFKETKWRKVGEAISETLSTAFEKVDKQQLADALWAVLSGALELAIGMIETSPVIGTIAVLAIGSKLGLGLGSGMATGFASSGFIASIPTLIGGAMVIGAGIIGYEMYNAYQKVHDAYITLFTDIPEFAEKQTAWFYEQVERHERNYQFLLDQGYSKRVADNALWAQGILEDYDNAIMVDEAFGWIYKKQNDINAKTEAWNDLTDKEKKALQDLIKQEWIINFTTKFGKTPQEMAQEWMENLKAKFQPIADKLKEVGNDWGAAIKNGLLSIFTGDTIKNQIKKSLPTTIEVTAVTNDAKRTVHAVKAYAGGGDPATGTLFIAGERGAELVSSTGRGTNVSNQNQIAASVAEGMEYANEEQNALLREQNALLRELVSKEFTSVAQITTGQIREALDRDNKRAGTALVAVN